LDKIKVAAVSYLNTKPLLYGIKRSEKLMNEIELIEDYPSSIAQMLINNEVDMGLVPVAIIPQLKEWYIVSDYCIGATEKVASVCLFGQEPMDKMEKILLDYQSKTSVELCKILMKDFWKKDIPFEDADKDYIKNIRGTTGGVIIGDRALEQRSTFPFIYDLAEAWIKFTGKPFVFAAWVANKPIPKKFVSLFNKANAEGVNNLNKVIAETPYGTYELNKYYSKNISYNLDSKKRKGLEFFLNLLNRDELPSATN
jgi:chorismate dehydratase